MQSEFKLYKVDMKYIRNLHSIDDKVLSVSPQTGKDNIAIHKRDRKDIKVYKQLCQQELEWCRGNGETVCNKATVLYTKYVSGEEFSGRERCLNFPKLELECKKYNLKQY